MRLRAANHSAAATASAEGLSSPISEPIKRILRSRHAVLAVVILAHRCSKALSWPTLQYSAGWHGLHESLVRAVL
jgi:hypothetical protein